MKLESAEFLKDFETMADIGKTPEGGCERLSMSDEDMQARQTLISMLEREGLAVEVDTTGAIWARLEGAEPELPAVLVGSHIDTVRNGGKYDGLLGVMLGFQAMRQLKRSGRSTGAPSSLWCSPPRSRRGLTTRPWAASCWPGASRRTSLKR